MMFVVGQGWRGLCWGGLGIIGVAVVHLGLVCGCVGTVGHFLPQVEGFPRPGIGGLSWGSEKKNKIRYKLKF